MSTAWLLVAVLAVLPQVDQDDTSGSIRPADLLAEIDYPDRWRWISEDRIPDGNLFDRILITSFITPLVFFEGDVGAGGGFGITDLDFLNQRRRQFANIWATTTTEGQDRFSFSWHRWLAHGDHPPRGVLQGDRDFIGFSVNHSRTLTSRFFGLGEQTTLQDEGSYTRESNSIGFGIQRSWPEVGGDWVWNIEATLQSDDLDSGKVTGAFDVATQHPILFAEGDDFEALWIRAGIRHDTRDAQHLPYKGHSIGASITTNPIVDGRKPGAVASLLASWIRPVAPIFHSGGDPARDLPPIDSVAGYLSLSSAAGDVPFWALPTLGGDNTLRGTIRGRFRDRCAWSMGGEWRPWVIAEGFPIAGDIRIERAGLALFADAGSVAGDLGDLLHSRIHSSVGIGVRFTLERQALFRTDLGWSDEGDANLSISYGLPF